MKQAKELMYDIEPIEQFELTPDYGAAQIEQDQQAIGYEAAYVRCKNTDELPF